MSTIRHEVERLGAEFFRLFKTIVVLAAEIKLEIRIFICRLGQKLPEALFHKAAVCLEHAVPEMGRRDDQTDAGGVLTADDAGKAGNEQKPQRENDVGFAAAKQADEHQCQQNAGESGDDVGDAHEHLVDPAAVPARESADHNAEEQPRGNRDHRNEQRGSRAFEHAGKNIAAEIVRAQKMGQRRRLHLGGGVHCFRIIGRPECADEDQKEHESGDAAADNEVVMVVFPHGSSAPFISF